MTVLWRSWIQLRIERRQKPSQISWLLDTSARQVPRFFLSLFGTTVVRRQGGTSVLNPEYVSHIAYLVDALAKKLPNLPQEDILVLSYYSEERRVLSKLVRKLGHSKVRFKSVDSSQGSKSPMVILSTTWLGGQ
jgi:regulator of nonsense transcripts 1